MSAARRFFGPSLAFAVVLLLGSGIYLRIRGSTDDAGGEDRGDLPQVSATSTFGTDVAIPVGGVAVVRDTLVVSVTAAGEAAASLESKVLSRVEGTAQRIPVRENQFVRLGQLLVALDTVDLALLVRDAEAGLAQAEADYRQRTLFDDQIEDPDVRAERELVARAQSGLDRAQVAVEQARLQLTRARVGAPFSGRVANLLVSQGHRVRVGDELMTVVDIDPIKVEVQVLEAEVGLLAAGRVAQVTFAAFPGETFVGHIETINPVIETDSRTARVTVRLPNPDGRILPGMYARVSLEARRFPDRILVPKSAVLERDRRTMVFVYEGDENRGLAKWNYVTTGLENDSLVEIVDNPDTEMLEPGQIVLIDGHNTLIHDAVVRLDENPRRAEGGRPR
ncbi:MAG: efflux RND transporter periplasmic adaptor subunit [Gemmatimonadetes bacterium]|nr:efflux RND transporter periplasmic adaptor subunit [Gemmatimonadota bacterium]